MSDGLDNAPPSEHWDDRELRVGRYLWAEATEDVELYYAPLDEVPTKFLWDAVTAINAVDQADSEITMGKLGRRRQ